MISKTKGTKMPRKKTQKLVHLDIEKMANESVEKKLPKEDSLGAILRAKRIRKKWEIEDVARRLKIKPVYLEALEQGHYYAFPARSYGVGFLRSYSRLMDLDPDKMTALFNQESSDIKEQPLDMLVMEKHFSFPSLKLLFCICLLIFGVYFILYAIAINYYPDMFKAVELPKEPQIIETVSESDSEEVVPVVAEEIKQPEVQKKEGFEKISDVVYSSPAALVATDTVWVGLKNTVTGKVLVSKKFVKNESFIPETPLAELAVSTGRPKLLVLYVNGKKVKTFGREIDLPLATFAEIPEEAKKD